jgi:hypothetical protein
MPSGRIRLLPMATSSILSPRHHFLGWSVWWTYGGWCTLPGWASTVWTMVEWLWFLSPPSFFSSLLMIKEKCWADSFSPSYCNWLFHFDQSKKCLLHSLSCKYFFFCVSLTGCQFKLGWCVVICLERKRHPGPVSSPEKGQTEIATFRKRPELQMSVCGILAQPICAGFEYYNV